MSEDDHVRLSVYLRMASRCMRCALEMYTSTLTNKESKMQKYSDADPDGGWLHGIGPASWVT